jgi:hypothetical protein
MLSQFKAAQLKGEMLTIEKNNLDFIALNKPGQTNFAMRLMLVPFLENSTYKKRFLIVNLDIESNNPLKKLHQNIKVKCIIEKEIQVCFPLSYFKNLEVFIYSASYENAKSYLIKTMWK